MLFTYIISFFIIFISVVSIQKFLWHSSFDTILITTIFITGAAVVIAMETNLKQIKMIIRNIFRERIK